MQANRLDGCPSTSFLTQLICLQCSDNDFRESDVSYSLVANRREVGIVGGGGGG